MKSKIINKLENLVSKENYNKANLIVKRNSSDSNVLTYYLNLLFEKKKYKLAVITFLKFCKETENELAIKIVSICLIETSDFSNAVKYLNRLVLLNPDSDNLSLLAIAQSKSNKSSEAINNFKKSIELPNTQPIAYINYANFLRDEDRNKDAIDILKKFNGYSKNFDILIIICGIYRDIQDYDKSIEFCKKAIEIDKENLNLLLIYGTIQLEKGELENSLKTFKRILTLKPFFGPAHRLISLMKKTIDQTELELLIDYINNSDQNQINNIHLGLAISNFLEGKKNYNQSFFFLKKFNTKFRESIDFDIKAYNLKFEKAKTLFNFLERQVLGSENKRAQPIFILGLPRSGTSLVEQILSNSEKIFACGELGYLDKVLQRITLESEQYSSTLNSFAIDYLDKIQLNFDINSDYFTDKMPLNFFYIGIINLVFPSSKVILCTRNLMDNKYSIFRNFFPEGNKFSYSLENINSFVSLYKEVIKFWKSKKVKMFEVNYENLITDFENQVKNIFNYLDLTFDYKYLDFYKNNRIVKTASLVQVKQPIFKSSIDQWKNYENFLSSQ